MTDPFHSSKYNIEHAKRRLTEFEWEVAAFRKSNPYAQVVEQNADGTEDFYKVKLIKSMPVGLPGIASDCLNALRSALDSAGYAIAIAVNMKGSMLTSLSGTIRRKCRVE